MRIAIYPGSFDPAFAAAKGTALDPLSVMGVRGYPPDLSGILSECTQSDPQHGDDRSGKYPL